MTTPDAQIPADLPREVLDALNLIEQEGADALTLSRLATRLGRGADPALSSLPWPDERALRTDLVTLAYHRLHRALLEAQAETSSPDQDAHHRLLACGRAYHRTAARSPALFALIRDLEAADFSHPRLQRESGAALQSLTDLVTALHAEGFESHRSPEELTRIVWDSAHRLTMRWAEAALGDELDADLVDEAIELEISLLLADGPPAANGETGT